MMFSVIIPTYNRANMIGKTLISLLEQSYRDFEIIVVDDGSTDDTEKVVRNINSSLISYFRIKNSERAFARNFGANLAKGEYINYFDSDDIALKNHLLEANKTLLELDKPEIFHLNYAIVNEMNQLIEVKTPPGKLANDFLLKGNILSCNGVFLMKNIAIENPFNEIRALSASEDWDLWLKLSVKYPIHMGTVVTSYVVNHNERSVLKFNEERERSRIQALLTSLKNDIAFMNKHSHALKVVEAHMYSYVSLHALLCGHKKKALFYIYYSVRNNYKELFSRRFLAIVKRLFFF